MVALPIRRLGRQIVFFKPSNVYLDTLTVLITIELTGVRLYGMRDIFWCQKSVDL